MCYTENVAATPAALAATVPDAFPALCRRFHVCRLDLFGSGADERFDQARSDLNFLVAFEALPGAAYVDAYFGLREGLAGLFGRPVDLLTEARPAEPLPASAGRGTAAAPVFGSITAGPAAKYLWDARRGAERIARFTTGHRPENYLADELLRSRQPSRSSARRSPSCAGWTRALPQPSPKLPRVVAFRNVGLGVVAGRLSQLETTQTIK